MSGLQRFVHVLLAMSVFAIIGGCGPSATKTVKVTGKVVDGGKPFTLEGPNYQEGAAYVEARFYAVGDSGTVAENATSYSTKLGLDGTFVMDGDMGDGIPVGKYKVALSHQGGEESRRMKKGGAAQGDLFQGKFSIDKTPFVFDIQDEQAIELDIAKAATPATN